MCMLFAATHPEMVRRLIMIDSYKPMSRQPNNVVDMTRLSGKIIQSMEKKNDLIVAVNEKDKLV